MAAKRTSKSVKELKIVFAGTFSPEDVAKPVIEWLQTVGINLDGPLSEEDWYWAQVLRRPLRCGEFRK